MASSFWTEDKYRIHFFCALCGGPFARVYRTDKIPDYRREESPASYDGTYDDDNTCTVPKAWNKRLSDDALRNNALPLVENEPGESWSSENQVMRGSVGDSDEAWRAYSGRHIHDEDMKWTKIMRALIHRHAQVHPEGGLEQLDNERDVYLTGRGRVLENGSWAVAYPSIVDELERDDDNGITLGDRSPFRFHLYQEPDRTDRKFHISSIPFHEECCDILGEAVLSAQWERGLEITAIENVVSWERFWSYLCDMIPTAVTGGLSDLTSESLASGTAEDPIQRLSIGCMGRKGYREAQRCADGSFWRHIKGLHWLAAIPRQPRAPFYPCIVGEQAEGLQSSLFDKYNHTTDPFKALPAEVLVEVFRYLSCADIFRWRVASLQLNLVVIPQREYRRFYYEEMAFLPALSDDAKYYERNEQEQDELIDWKSTFERASRTWREDSRQCNRRRIWKIVYPMAEELVETSSQNLRAIADLSEEVSTAISVVRGNVGIRSGVDGEYHTLVFSDLFRPRFEPRGRDPSSRRPAPTGTIAWPAWEDHTTTPPEEFSCALERIDIWLHPERKHMCGLRFIFLNERSSCSPQRTVSKILGTRTTLCESFSVDNANHILTGFRVCWAYGFLRGIQFVFEDMLKEPTEYCEAEFFSPCYGQWDGPVRRLVAPRKFRTLAGVTAFVNDAGLIETFAILEKKRPVMNPGRHYLLTPPDTVPLSHHEASLWKSPPPNDVNVLERLGPSIADWRTWTAQCEVFAATALYQPPGRISHILHYSDGEYLVGLRFLYNTEDGQTVHRDIGDCDGKVDVNLLLTSGDEVSHAVIGHGRMGIHSLQLVTSSGEVGPACGMRYVGVQAAYALKNTNPGSPQERSGNLSYLERPIIGFHCLYSSKLHRILQLGILTRASGPSTSSSAANLPSPGPAAIPSVGLPLPFIDIDDLSNPWVDGRPPHYLVRGRKNSDSMKTLKVASSATFAGWISLRDSISSMTVYGHMQGVRFTYVDERRSDRFFGNTSPSLPQETYRFEKSKRPFQYIAHQRPRPESDANYARGDHLPTIRLSRDNPSMDPMLEPEVISKYLAGIKFNFSADWIIDWQPLFDYNASSNRPDSNGELHERKHCWKSSDIMESYPWAEADQDLDRHYPVLADFLIYDKPKTKIDGIKGYWTSTALNEVVDGVERDIATKRFCGLRFRRQGLWDEEPLGQASAYEQTFLLSPHEEIVSISICGAGQFGIRGAVAFTTNFGRTTPWIGDPGKSKPMARKPPPGRKLVGLYLAYCGPRHFDTVGIIYDKAVGNGEDALVFPLTPPNSSTLTYEEAAISLDWTVDPNYLPPDHLVSKSVGDGPAAITERKFVPPANTLVDPENLELIEAYVNTVHGRYGIKALRFHGTRRMGTKLLGNWQEERARPVPQQKMRIKGVEGERIIGIKFTFHKHDQGNRIIGFLIKTNLGQEHDLSSWSSVTDESPPESEIYHEEFNCEPGKEVVGFQYLSRLYVHDIAVITRPRIESSKR